MSNKRALGAAGEAEAAQYLKERGMTVIQCNFRCRQGEIDIVGRHGEYLVFVEVKYRRGAASGLPEDAVDKNKMRKICRVSDYYRYLKGYDENRPFRYDVVAIDDKGIRWYQDAFDYVK